MVDKSIHESMMEITKFMPMRAILTGGKPYLQRYYVGKNRQGVQTWMHRFLSADVDRHFHSHPWYADSTIICGGYVESSTLIDNLDHHHIQRFGPGDLNIINPTTLHKISSCEPNTWTVMQVKPNWTTWYFINKDGEIQEMGKTHSVNWWMDYQHRKLDDEINTPD